MSTGPQSFKDLVDHVRGDLAVNENDTSRPGFRAMVVQRVGAWRRTIENPVLRKPVGLAYRAGHRFVRNRYGIEIHGTTSVGRRCRIAHQNGIVIHEWATIGDDCLIRQGVTIGQVSGTADRAGAPTIGDRVEIGAGAMVIGPVTIGDDARIGPHAVVLRDVPDGATAMGPPAKVIAADAATGDR